jgi:hypothetical protein
MRPNTIYSARTNIVIVPPALQAPGQRRGRPKKNNNNVVYATNILPKGSVTREDIDDYGYELTRVYRLHWGMETDWSMFKSFRPRTTSPKSVIRAFYFYASVLLYDVWVLARRIHGRACKRVLTRVGFFQFYLPVSRIEVVSPIFLEHAPVNYDLPNG